MLLTFTVPYTGHEILVFSDDGAIAGVAYNPLSTSPPTTWLKRCGRCLTGDRRVPLKVRRAVRCLATLAPTRRGLSVRVFTGRKCTHSVSVMSRRGGKVLTVRSHRDKTLAPLVMSVQGGVTKATSGRPRDYRAPVLLLTLRLLLSAREPSGREVQAILQGLPADPVPRRHCHDAEVVQLIGGGARS